MSPGREAYEQHMGLTASFAFLLVASCALRLRQAKLSFPVVHLMVGVFSDTLCERHGETVRTPHLERCELVRHCRWVDEVVPEAPWRLDEVFLRARRIDYVAIDEGASVNPTYGKERVKGYDVVKSLSGSIHPLFQEKMLIWIHRHGDPNQAYDRLDSPF